jgi:hypothetical protein
MLILIKKLLNIIIIKYDIFYLIFIKFQKLVINLLFVLLNAKHLK